MAKELTAIEIRNEIDETIKNFVLKCEDKNLRKPLLVVLCNYENDGNIYYSKAIKNKGDKLGVNVLIKEITNKNENEIINLINELNDDENVDGIMILKPLPKGCDFEKCINEINVDKDVEGLSNNQLAKFYRGEIDRVPCTALSAMKILQHYQIDLKGKKVCVIGRSLTVGKAVALLCLNEDATVTICHSKTKNLIEETRNAEIVISAIGKAKYINHEYIKDGQIVVDVGTSNDENGNLCGDIDYDDVKEMDIMITPVKAGVGSCTTSLLLESVVELYRRKHDLRFE